VHGEAQIEDLIGEAMLEVVKKGHREGVSFLTKQLRWTVAKTSIRNCLTKQKRGVGADRAWDCMGTACELEKGVKGLRDQNAVAYCPEHAEAVRLVFLGVEQIPKRTCAQSTSLAIKMALQKGFLNLTKKDLTALTGQRQPLQPVMRGRLLLQGWLAAFDHGPSEAPDVNPRDLKYWHVGRDAGAAYLTSKRSAA
jgi:hypothetical protein